MHSFITEHCKELIQDKEITADLLNSDFFYQKRLERVFAVRRRFENVSFKQAVIKDSYFRNCEFVDCIFVGAHISSSNFQGARFQGCDFSYTTFEKTDIGLDILTHNLPPHENLKQELARSLRVNYASVGNYEGVNRAILVELAATLEHYCKVAFSGEAHYRKKYKGTTRVSYALRYIGFGVLEKLWGNGERPWRLVPVALIVWLLAAGYAFVAGGVSLAEAGATAATAIVLGNSGPFPVTGIVTLTLVRYVILGMFLAALVKRLARR